MLNVCSHIQQKSGWQKWVAKSKIRNLACHIYSCVFIFKPCQCFNAHFMYDLKYSIKIVFISPTMYNHGITMLTRPGAGGVSVYLSLNEDKLSQLFDINCEGKSKYSAQNAHRLWFFQIIALFPLEKRRKKCHFNSRYEYVRHIHAPLT